MTSSDFPADDRYGPAVVHGALFVGALLVEREKDDKRAARMRVALEDQVVAYRNAFPHAASIDTPINVGILDLVPTDWPPELATTYLVDLQFTRPFSPA